MLSSVPRKADSFCSSSLCWSWVPQMKRTEAMPKPWLSRPLMGGGNEIGVVGQPQIVVGTEVQHLLAAHRNPGLLGRGDDAFLLV